MFTKAEEQFLELYRSGIWEKPVKEEIFDGSTDWETIKDLMLAQTVIGVCTNVISKLPAQLKPNQNIYFNLIMLTSNIEQANKAMNNLLIELFDVCEKLNIKAFLLKGQAVAQCYPKPLLRQSGDIDLLFLETGEYKKAVDELHKYFSVPMTEVDPDRPHALFICKDIVVELHGDIHGAINRKAMKNTMTWTKRMFAQNPSLICNIGEAKVVLPPVHFDALFIFLHAARHYFGSAVGLRQLSDWMRYLYTHKDDINRTELLKDIEYLGLTKVWSVFATMAVDYLGCPEEVMPLYNNRYKKDAKRLLRYILDSGNFGYHDKRIQTTSKNLFVQRFIAMKGHLEMQFRNIVTFPEESLYGIPFFFKDGFKRFIKAFKK